MALRKRDSFNWTLVLVLVLFNSVAHSRPQVDSSTLSVSSVDAEKSTETSIRYRYTQNNLNNTNSLPYLILNNKNQTDINYFNNKVRYINSNILNPNNRTSRVTRKKIKIIRNPDSKNNIDTPFRDSYQNTVINKPVIKKVITKWVDNSKFEHFNIDQPNSPEEDESGAFANSFDTGSTKNNQYKLSNKRYTYTQIMPNPPNSEEVQVHSNNFHVIGSSPYAYITRPNYIFTTPTPTPIITNVGYPQPWPNNNNDPNRPAKPNKPKNPYNSIMNFSPYPNHDFDVTTFPPTSAYTDRIVIRPQEYNGSSDDCPTIFLTLNNTFQGQGKEACPDLNIAVNTNVVNKNVVVESEEDTDTTLTDVFGLPIEDSGSEEDAEDYTGSEENDEDVPVDESSEDFELSSYNSANSVYDTQSSESTNSESASSPITAVSKPGRPSTNDDVFSLSSFIDFFRPAISAFSWLAAINPFSFTAISFFLTPLILLFAGISSLFAPFALSAREAPHIHIYSPEWQWGKNDKEWQLNSYPSSREWEQPRKYGETLEPNLQSAFLAKFKELLKIISMNLSNKYTDINFKRRNKRKKRETWTIRVK